MVENAKIDVQIKMGELLILTDLDTEIYALSYFLTVIVIGT